MDKLLRYVCRFLVILAFMAIGFTAVGFVWVVALWNVVQGTGAVIWEVLG